MEKQEVYDVITQLFSSHETLSKTPKAERTWFDLAISPTHFGVTTSNTQNKPKSSILRAQSFPVPPP